MKNKKLFIILAIMSFPPWGMLLRYAPGPSLIFQLVGLGVQLVGLTFLVTRRKQIF